MAGDIFVVIFGKCSLSCYMEGNSYCPENNLENSQQYVFFFIDV